MKIRALVDDYSYFLGFRKGDVFEASLSKGGACYDFFDNDGDNRFVITDHFEVVNEEFEEELEEIIKELEIFNVRSWRAGLYGNVCSHETEMTALDKAIEILKGMRR